MRRHATDPVSLVFGLLFIAIAAVGATDVFSLTSTDLRWLGPGLLVLLGLVLVLGAGFGRGRRPEAATRSPAEGASEREGAPDEEGALQHTPDAEADAGGEGVGLSGSRAVTDPASGDERPPSAEV